MSLRKYGTKRVFSSFKRSIQVNTHSCNAIQGGFWNVNIMFLRFESVENIKCSLKYDRGSLSKTKLSDTRN